MTGGAEPVVLRVMAADDIPDGLRLSAAAGWNQTGEDWRFLLEGNPGRFVVALRGGRVLGSGGAVCYGSALAWVCMILVDPEARGHGIGTQIVQGVLDRLTDVSAVGLDATPHGQGVYARLGFVETSRLLRVEAAGPAADGRPEPGRTDVASVRTIDAGDFDRILEVDLRVFGADRADLLRWAARLAPALCRVDDAGAIVGYCFGRRGSRSRQIGPVVARDAATARALVSAAMHAEPRGRVVLDVPAERADWLALLEEMGFAVQRPLIRMFRASRPPGHPARQWAIFGPEFG
ncbi:MAG TPA: GNAT family N-acetyltransferase [Vicinamibacteria bacterium]